MYKVVEISRKDAEVLFTPVENNQSEIFQVLLKHRRFSFLCETPEEAREDRGWHFKFDAECICHRIYDRLARFTLIEDYERHIIRLPCPREEKQHEVWLIKPGVDGIFFFYGGRDKGASYYFPAIDKCINDIFCGIPGVTYNGNDLLVNGGKAAGIDYNYNSETGTLQVTAGLTWNADAVKGYAGAFDHSKKKYSGFAGFDETGMRREDFDKRIKNLYEAVKCL